MRRFAIIFTLFALLSCTAEQSYSVRMLESEMKRCPAAADLDGMGGKLKWNYTTGLELLSFLDAAYPSARSKGPVLEYVDAWYDAIIREDGSVGANYKKAN